MRMRGWLGGATGAALLATAPFAAAADPGAGADFLSAYVWRGITMQQAPVLQPWVDLSGIPLGRVGSLGLNVWTNLPLRDVSSDGQLMADGGALSEFATTATFSLPKGLEAGFAEYTMRRTRAGDPVDTGEVFVGWTGSFGVELRAHAYFDVQSVDGFYGTVVVARTLRVGTRLKMTLEAGAGVASRNFAVACGGTRGGPFDYSLSALLDLAVSEKVTLGIRLARAGTLDRQVLPTQSVSLSGGLVASVWF